MDVSYRSDDSAVGAVRALLCVDSSSSVVSSAVVLSPSASPSDSSLPLTLDTVNSALCNELFNDNKFYADTSGNPTLSNTFFTDANGLSFGNGALCLLQSNGVEGVWYPAAAAASGAASNFFPTPNRIYTMIAGVPRVRKQIKTKRKEKKKEKTQCNAMQSNAKQSKAKQKATLRGATVTDRGSGSGSGRGRGRGSDSDSDCRGSDRAAAVMPHPAAPRRDA